MAQQQAQQGSDNGMAPVWITILLFFTAYVIWKTGHQHIVNFVFFINIWQAKFINLFLHNQSLSNQINLMQTIDPKTVDWNQLVDMTRDVGNYIRYPIVCILVVLAVILYRSNITLKFRRSHDMKS